MGPGIVTRKEKLKLQMCNDPKVKDLIEELVAERINTT